MARSVSEIQAEIIRYKDSVPELKALSSRSATAVWRLWVFIMAVAHYAHELYFDLFRDEINETLNKRIQGTAEWYAQKAIEYQEGADLKVISGGTQLGYEPVQVSQRIVTRAAYREEPETGRLVLKLAQGDVDNLSKLDGTQVLRINKYFERIKFAGTNLAISSLDPDLLIPNMTVYHDGILGSTDIFSQVQLAIEEFIQNIPFDAVFYVTKFVDAIQQVEHVTDVKINSITIRSFEDINNPLEEVVVRKKILDSGYLKASPEIGERLSDVVVIEIEQ
jgi:hypothetical protein